MTNGRVTPCSSGDDNLLGRMTKELATLEKRDGELWLILTIAGITSACGFLALIFPAAFLRSEQLHFEFNISRELFLSLVVFLALVNTYLLGRRYHVRRLREQLLSTTLQNELIRLQSFTDPLTEVYNRRSLEDLAGRYISAARRQSKPLTFAVVDVDEFKRVNTRFGHLTGDFVLSEVAKLLNDTVRGSDAVVRYGGDEFILILADATRDAAQNVSLRLSRYLDEWNSKKHVDDLQLSLSVGMAEFREGLSFDEVLDAADSDMYANKHARKAADVTSA